MIARLRRHVEFWNEREAPDAQALLRITFAASLLGGLLEQLFAGVVLELYALPEEGGIFPIEPSRNPFDLFAPGRLVPTAGVVWGLFWLQFSAGTMLMLGLLTRLSAIVCFVVQTTFYDRMPMFSFGGDNVLRVFLWLMVLSSCGRAWGMDALLFGRVKDVPCWPRRLFVFQLAVVYVTTGLMKLGSSWTILDGWSALYLALNLPGLARWSGDWAAWVYPLTQLGTFVSRWWEILFFLVPLNMHLRRRRAEGAKLGPVRRLIACRDLRTPFVVLGIVFHLSLTVLFDLGLFSATMLSLYPCLLKPEEAGRLLDRFASEVRRGRSP